MDAGTVSHIFLSDAPQHPHVAYVSAKRRLVVIHVQVDEDATNA